MLNTFIKSKGVMKTITHNNNKTNSNEINMDADYDGNVANIKLQTNNNGTFGTKFVAICSLDTVFRCFGVNIWRSY